MITIVGLWMIAMFAGCGFGIFVTHQNPKRWSNWVFTGASIGGAASAAIVYAAVVFQVLQ